MTPSIALQMAVSILESLSDLHIIDDLNFLRNGPAPSTILISIKLTWKYSYLIVRVPKGLLKDSLALWQGTTRRYLSRKLHVPLMILPVDSSDIAFRVCLKMEEELGLKAKSPLYRPKVSEICCNSVNKLVLQRTLPRSLPTH